MNIIEKIQSFSYNPEVVATNGNDYIIQVYWDGKTDLGMELGIHYCLFTATITPEGVVEDVKDHAIIIEGKMIEPSSEENEPFNLDSVEGRFFFDAIFG